MLFRDTTTLFSCKPPHRVCCFSRSPSPTAKYSGHGGVFGTLPVRCPPSLPTPPCPLFQRECGPLRFPTTSLVVPDPGRFRFRVSVDANRSIPSRPGPLVAYHVLPLDYRPTAVPSRSFPSGSVLPVDQSISRDGSYSRDLRSVVRHTRVFITHVCNNCLCRLRTRTTRNPPRVHSLGFGT
jgi:hypothetical protein